ncbi:MAG TPA: hypothetical protein PK800_01215, partial [Syntrophorhabdaceae bacterium]|nr:hypothetical protein [Syntrophorhabdaceae bacterium]
LSSVLDVEDFIEHPYILEVSSPGITRPLKTVDDFKRSIGRLCRIITSQPISGKREMKGVILSADEKEIQIQGKIDVFTIPMYAIKKANLDFEI